MRSSSSNLVALALIVTAVLLGFTMHNSVAGGPVVERATNRHFDHDAHAAAQTKMGKPAAKCESCHKQDATGEPQLVGKREHARCLEGCHTFTADCGTMAAGVGKVCASCHPTLKPACLPPLPARAPASFESKFTHGRHTAAGASAEPLCARCHEVQAFAVGTPQPTTTAHRACSGCHERGAKPFMAECAGCHRAPSQPLATAPNPYRLEQFDHRDHMKSSKTQTCLTCHQGLAGSSENSLPHPQMKNCQNQCHNGKTAFTTTGTHCTTCHKATNEQVVPTQPALEVSFSHQVHQKRNVDMKACGSCHQVETNGQVLAPGMNKDHKPCADSGCHETEFFSRTTKVCTVCHGATGTPSAMASIVPWKKPTMTTIQATQSELPSPMNHAAHVAAVGGAAGNATCLGCHGDKFTNGPSPRGHAACAKCHNKPTSASSPAMSNCVACHELGATIARRPVSSWSVAANFAHTSHSKDPQKGGAAPACAECHASVTRSTTLTNMTAPTMQTCDRCHNGREAFKTTGFDCARCHAQKKISTTQSNVLDTTPKAPTANLGSPARTGSRG
jgi:c(7)-type cytochrome triheme protein